MVLVYTPPCSMCRQDNEIVLHAFMQCVELRGLIAYVIQLMLKSERVQLSAEAIIKIMLPPSFNKEGLPFSV